ncbi:BrnA antitoxin family protein [Methylotuvimicrobium sp.]|uniref:BrnA antitoxin family protein n=1 Tax=Methylotuvimicrobium sp. TaxID=2822413 RepID=UPI003D64CF69
MSKPVNPELIDDENPEWTEEMISRSVRFDDVLDAFKTTGSGWQTRMNEALKEWLKEHPAA